MPETRVMEVPASLEEMVRRCVSMLLEEKGALSREEYLFLLRLEGIDPRILSLEGGGD